MITLFVGRLAEEATLGDVRRLFLQATHQSLWTRVQLKWLRGFDLNQHAEFDLHQKKYHGEIIRYATVDLPSMQVARFFINALNGTTVRGQGVIVREYAHRAYANDRRNPANRSKPYPGTERRRAERRGATEYLWGLQTKTDRRRSA